jgi:AcrR family transcriptional regulator
MMNDVTGARLSSADRKSGKLSRAEKNETVRRRLFAAAAKIVGQYGYAGASVARITAESGVAQGTFYNHFGNRQELLDQLLPSIGQDMLAFIRERVSKSATEEEREAQRFRAFFDFLQDVPEFLRILNEAEFFAAEGYQRHLDNVATGYVHVLRSAREGGRIQPFSDDELEVLVHILMGARGYLSRRYAYAHNGVGRVPESVISAYVKLLRHGLFVPEANRASLSDASSGPEKDGNA